MQVISRVDIGFVSFYSFLILLMGTGIFIGSGQLIMIPITILIEAVYLFIRLKQPYRRLQAISKPFPREWQNIIGSFSLFYRNLDPLSKSRFEKDVAIVMADCSIEGRQRQELNTRTRLLVAAGFATVLNGRPDWEPPIRDGVLVYPGSTFNRDYESNRGNRAGQATVNSPLIVTEQSLEDSFARHDDGYNVIYHELAHYFDFEDGVAEGIPGARMLSERLPQWRDLIRKEWQKVIQGRSFLRPYAGTNESEFFAVAVEAFFEIPGDMIRHNRDLYGALKEFFNIDTYSILESDTSYQ
jgi:Mlc titration factor MtfA (ptsG expression regulator)